VKEVLVKHEPQVFEALNDATSHEQSFHRESGRDEHGSNGCPSVMTMTEEPGWVEKRVDQTCMRRGKVEPSSASENPMGLDECGSFRSSGEMFDDIEEANGIKGLVPEWQCQSGPRYELYVCGIQLFADAGVETDISVDAQSQCIISQPAGRAANIKQPWSRLQQVDALLHAAMEFIACSNWTWFSVEGHT